VAHRGLISLTPKEDTHLMTSPEALEFLLVSGDYKTLSAVGEGLRRVGATFGFVPTADSAGDYIRRRRVDGIFVDLDVPSAVELIHAIRQGTSNRNSAVFACIPNVKQSPAMIVPGANFLLHKPLDVEVVVSHVTAAQDMMTRERQRYFRHPVSLPVSMTIAETEQHAMITNLSESGMAVRATKPLALHSVLDFAFQLPAGPTISGRGLIAWANSEGLVGIKFQTLRDAGQGDLVAWLTNRKRLASAPPAEDN
jgi:DNA-binding response OmpR family regulator